MIGGTSTGGLIAIMLGRLQMTVDDCITAYTSMFDRIFEKKRHRVTIKGKIQGRFDADELKRAVIQILRGQGLDENSLLKGLTYFDLLPHFADCCAAEFPGSFDSIREKNLYSLARDRKWVTYRGQKILWLPPDYRPKAMEEYYAKLASNLGIRSLNFYRLEMSFLYCEYAYTGNYSVAETLLVSHNSSQTSPESKEGNAHGSKDRSKSWCQSI
ncbi:hypothetical protein GB937_006383 [Aspergillus fischeri]|nr:hypothetical protein GB937_006383 [Aspergillus fischeri]